MVKQVLALLMLILLALPDMARAETSISAGIAPEVVAITTDFTGSHLTVFGAITPQREQGDHVVILLHGPPVKVTLREQQPVAGMWLNRGRVTYEGVTGLYYVASSTRDLSSLAGQDIRALHQIGTDVLPLRPSDRLIEDATRLARLNNAVISLLKQRGLYGFDPQPLVWDGPSLFRAEFDLPAAAHPGTYEVDVLLIRDGKLQASAVKTLVLGKSGLSARIASFAEDWPVLYALAAILLATLAGFTANRVMGKRG
ncbi:MAG: TIGR02186 family protein [Alphaproteobacteria bacterium]